MDSTQRQRTAWRTHRRSPNVSQAHEQLSQAHEQLAQFLEDRREERGVFENSEPSPLVTFKVVPVHHQHTVSRSVETSPSFPPRWNTRKTRPLSRNGSSCSSERGRLYFDDKDSLQSSSSKYSRRFEPSSSPHASPFVSPNSPQIPKTSSSKSPKASKDDMPAKAKQLLLQYLDRAVEELEFEEEDQQNGIPPSLRRLDQLAGAAARSRAAFLRSPSRSPSKSPSKSPLVSNSGLQRSPSRSITGKTQVDARKKRVAAWGSSALFEKTKEFEKAEAEKQHLRQKIDFLRGETGNLLESKTLQMIFKSHRRMKNTTLSRMILAVWSSAIRESKTRLLYIQKAEALKAQYNRLRLAWNFTAWNVICRKTKAARINSARQFACLRYKLKLVDVLRALKGQVVESTRRRRADEREKRNTRLMQNKVASVSAERLASCFESWLRLVTACHRNSTAALERLAQRRREETLKRSTFAAFRRMMKAGQVLMRWLKAGVVMVFERWCELVDEKRELRRKARRVVMRLMKLQVVMAFEQWRDHIIEQKQMKSKALKVLRRLMNVALVLSFERWRDHMIEEKQMKSKALKVLQRLMNGALVLSFERWRDHMIEAKQMKSKALKVLQRLMNGALVLSFDRWRDHIIEQKQMKSKALKVLQRLMNGALVLSFERWRDYMIEEKQMKSKALKVLQRLMNGALVLSFDRWRDHMIEAKQMKSKALKVLQRLMNGALVLSFERWRDYIIEAKQMKSKAFKVVLQRLMNSGLVEAFQRWREHVEWELRTKTLMVVMRLMKARLVMALERWHDCFIHGKRMRRVANKVVRRWIKATLFSAYASWLKRTSGGKRMRRVADKVVRRWNNATMCAAYLTWHNRVTERKRLQKVADKVVLRVVKASMCAAYLAWCKRASDGKRLQNVAQKVVRLVRNLPLATAFQFWYTRLLVCSNLSRVVYRLQCRAIALAFERWCNMASQQRVMFRRVARIVFHTMHRRIAEAFKNWVSSVILRRELQRLNCKGEEEVARLRIEFQNEMNTLIKEGEEEKESQHRSQQQTQIELQSMKEAHDSLLERDSERKVELAKALSVSEKQVRNIQELTGELAILEEKNAALYEENRNRERARESARQFQVSCMQTRSKCRALRNGLYTLVTHTKAISKRRILIHELSLKLRMNFNKHAHCNCLRLLIIKGWREAIAARNMETLQQNIDALKQSEQLTCGQLGLSQEEAVILRREVQRLNSNGDEQQNRLTQEVARLISEMNALIQEGEQEKERQHRKQLQMQKELQSMKETHDTLLERAKERKAELAEALSVSEKQQRILLEKDRERKAELAEALSVSGKQQRHIQELTGKIATLEHKNRDIMSSMEEEEIKRRLKHQHIMTEYQVKEKKIFAERKEEAAAFHQLVTEVQQLRNELREKQVQEMVRQVEIQKVSLPAVHEQLVEIYAKKPWSPRPYRHSSPTRSRSSSPIRPFGSSIPTRSSSPPALQAMWTTTSPTPVAVNPSPFGLFPIGSR